MPYLNVAEIESWTELVALAHPALCARIMLPHTTSEGRTCFAVRVKAGPRANRHGVLLLANQHAREWGSADIVVDLVERLVAAFEQGNGVTFQGRAYTAQQVRDLLDATDLFVVPCVNPDGRYHSQTVEALWRKNRRPIPGTTGVGTDLNRNFDFLWDFRTAFDPVMYDRMSPNELSVNDDPSADPSRTFHGTAPFSEAETRNVRWLLDQHRHIRFLVDVHSYRQMILYPWGDDNTQTTDPAQTFQDAAFDGARGPANAGYGEYMHPVDAGRLADLAGRMRNALAAVRGKVYLIGDSFTNLYPTCGTSTCYAFSRHLVSSAKGKVDAFLVEWGTTFQPPYDTDMVPIFDDVGAAMTELCLTADHVPLVEVRPRGIRYPYPKSAPGRPWNTPIDRTLTITNLGPRPVDILSATIEPGPRAGDFSVAAPSATSLTPGMAATLVVTYTPATPTPRARLLITVVEAGQTLTDVLRVDLTRAPRPKRTRKPPWRRKRVKIPKRRKPRPNPRVKRRTRRGTPRRAGRRS